MRLPTIVNLFFFLSEKSALAAMFTLVMIQDSGTRGTHSKQAWNIRGKGGSRVQHNSSLSLQGPNIFAIRAQRQCHDSRDFQTCFNVIFFFFINRTHLGPIWTGKNGFAIFFRFWEDIRETRVRVVNVSAFQRSCWLRGHRVSVVVDCADTCQRSQHVTVKKTKTILLNLCNK